MNKPCRFRFVALILVCSALHLRSSTADEGADVLKAYIAQLEPLENFDVVVHRKQQTTVKKDVKIIEQKTASEHYRLIKSADGRWAVRAKIETFPAENLPDLKKLELDRTKNAATLEYNYRGAAVAIDKITKKEIPVARLADLLEFERAYFQPSPELICVPVGPILPGVDRHTRFDDAIANLGSMVTEKVVGDEIYLGGGPAKPEYLYIGVLKLDQRQRVPTGFTMLRNKSFSGKHPDIDRNFVEQYEHKQLNGISLPVKKKVEGYYIQVINGEEVRTEDSTEIELKWLAVNENLEFPDVYKVVSEYKSLYEFIFHQ